MYKTINGRQICNSAKTKKYKHGITGFLLRTGTYMQNVAEIPTDCDRIKHASELYDWTSA